MGCGQRFTVTLKKHSPVQHGLRRTNQIEEEAINPDLKRSNGSRLDEPQEIKVIIELHQSLYCDIKGRNANNIVEWQATTAWHQSPPIKEFTAGTCRVYGLRRPYSCGLPTTIIKPRVYYGPLQIFSSGTQKEKKTKQIFLFYPFLFGCSVYTMLI